MELVGCDVYIYAPDGKTPELPQAVGPLRLELIANRGTKVWPQGAARLDFYSDEWRCRFTSEGNQPVQHRDLDELVKALMAQGKFWTRLQVLWMLPDGSKGFSQPY